MSIPSTFDYYIELQVERSASLEQITSAYRRLARVHHPDRNHGSEENATIAFQRLQQAYETLSDPVKRDRYDHLQSSANPAFHEENDDEDEEIHGDFYYHDYAFHTNATHSEFRDAPSDRGTRQYRNLWTNLFNSGFRTSHSRYSNFDDWEREMERRERAAAELEAEYSERVRTAYAERKAREEQANARREAKQAAKQAAQDAKMAEIDARKEEEAQLQEQRWKEAGIVTIDEKLLTCLHSDYCRKIGLRKKVKCSSCSARRGTVAFECPHCLVHLCQLCVAKFSADRQKLDTGVENTAPPPSMTSTSADYRFMQPEEESHDDLEILATKSPEESVPVSVEDDNNTKPAN